MAVPGGLESGSRQPVRLRFPLRLPTWSTYWGLGPHRLFSGRTRAPSPWSWQSGEVFPPPRTGDDFQDQVEVGWGLAGGGGGSPQEGLVWLCHLGTSLPSLTIPSLTWDSDAAPPMGPCVQTGACVQVGLQALRTRERHRWNPAPSDPAFGAWAAWLAGGPHAWPCCFSGQEARPGGILKAGGNEGRSFMWSKALSTSPGPECLLPPRLWAAAWWLHFQVGRLRLGEGSRQGVWGPCCVQPGLSPSSWESLSTRPAVRGQRLPRLLMSRGPWAVVAQEGG